MITDMTFLFCFLPIALVLYYFLDNKVKEFILFILSLLFYAVGSIKYLFIFSCSVAITVLLGRTMTKAKKNCNKKILLIIGIVLNTGLLVYYKYTDFFISNLKLSFIECKTKNIVLPLGISFFTFKSISYLVDVYKERAKLEVNPIHDALYLSFFAQIQSGPLSRYNDMSGNKNKFDFDLFAEGVYRFLIGFCKKILIANVLSNVSTEIFGTSFEKLSTSYMWLGSICFSLQLFYDFSGYSDMAIGITNMFGYNCPENFNYPYMTESVSRFWRRWHITLSSWFRDYIYIPLGGSRNKHKWRVYVNLFAVWLLTGIWHGAAWNFIVWGMGYFIAISVERLLGLPQKINSFIGKIIYRVLTLVFINFQWTIFNSKDLISALVRIKKMLIFTSNKITDMRTVFLLKDYAFFIVVAIVFSIPVIPWIKEKTKNNKYMYALYEILSSIIIVGAFIWAISFVVAGQNNPFAYANF